MSRYLVIALIALGFTTRSFGATNIPVPPGKIITIVVNSGGNVRIGRDTLMIDGLTAELQNRLWKTYMGTGKMYDSLKLVFEGEVLMGTRGAAMDAIQLAQKKALTDICLEKHKKHYEDLSASQQNKIKKQFPVLFQTTYE